MEDLKIHGLLLFLPMVIGNVIHMVIVKKNWFAKLAIPISLPLFGANKTYRGFIVLPIISGCIAYFNSVLFDFITLSKSSIFFIGFGLGMAYMLFELPNSYIKRKLGVVSGENSKKYSIVQKLIDKLDSLVGIFIFYYVAMPVTFKMIAVLFTAALIIHISVSYLLVVIKVKKSF
mgnify:CR=1 FL=1